MSQENKNEKHRGILMVITVAIAVPLLYVLSFGPALAICEKYPRCAHTVADFYVPMFWLHNNTALRRPLESYLGLWGIYATAQHWIR